MLRQALLLILFTPLSLSAQQPSQPLQRLTTDIDRLTRSVNATWSIYIKCVETGEEVLINADRPMETMSTIKIPLMVEVFAQINEGRFKLQDRYKLTPDDAVAGSGILQHLDIGVELTLKDLVTLMINVSDNVATDILYRMVGGPEAVNRRMDALGFKHTRVISTARSWFTALDSAPDRGAFHRDWKYPFGVSTARELGRLMEMMARGNLVDKASSELMLKIMRTQTLGRSRMRRYIAGYRVPSKTGDFPPYIANDVGLLEAPGKTVVVSILNANHFGNADALENAVALVAKQAADYFAYRN